MYRSAFPNVSHVFQIMSIYGQSTHLLFGAGKNHWQYFSPYQKSSAQADIVSKNYIKTFRPRFLSVQVGLRQFCEFGSFLFLFLQFDPRPDRSVRVVRSANPTRAVASEIFYKKNSPRFFKKKSEKGCIYIFNVWVAKIFKNFYKNKFANFPDI